MGLTIAQALSELPILSKARVVAGDIGLHHIIRWTHIMDHPDLVPWIKDGNLFMTTAFGLVVYPETQVGLVARLAEKGVVGMLVNIGRYMLEIPRELIEAADQLDFPILTLPWDVDLVEVTYAIHERIISEHNALNEMVFHIHEVLTKIVLDGGGLPMLTQSLAELLRRSVTIEDTDLQLLAHATSENIDEVRRRSIAEGRTPPEVVDFLTKGGLFERLRREPRPFRVPVAPEVGLTLERIIAPIMAGLHLYGYIWVIASDRPLTELDYLALERGASVAALILSRQEAVYEAEQRVKTELWGSLLEADAESIYNLSTTVRKLGLHNGYQILVIEDRLTAVPLRSLSRLVNEVLGAEAVPATVVEWSGTLILLYGSVATDSSLAIAQRILDLSTPRGHQLVIGLSSPHTQTVDMRRCYQEAMDALHVGAGLADRGGVWVFDQLGFLCWLQALPPEIRRANRFSAIINSIAAADYEKGTELLKTLEAYLDHRAAAAATAAALFIHRNTLYQRLSKLQDDWHLDLDDPLTFFNLYVALKDWRLHRS